MTRATASAVDPLSNTKTLGDASAPSVTAGPQGVARLAAESLLVESFLHKRRARNNFYSKPENPTSLDHKS